MKRKAPIEKEIEGSTGFSSQLIKNLSDKDKGKKRVAGKEIEFLLKKHIKAKNDVEILKMIKSLTEVFGRSENPNMRVGGLWGLACCSVVIYGYAKKRKLSEYLHLIFIPVLELFTDKNKSVRFAAVESCYNLCKNCRHRIMSIFPELFNGICVLSGDGEQLVQNGNMLLTRLIKDISLESQDSFNVQLFVGLLKSRMYSKNEFVREFLMSWISSVQNSPHYDLLPFLPHFLDGVFKILNDMHQEVALQAESVLSEFLRMIIENEEQIDLIGLIPILLVNTHDSADNSKRIALVWVREFLKKGGVQLLKFTSQLLSIIFPSVSSENQIISGFAEDCNDELLQIVVSTKEVPPLEKMIAQTKIALMTPRSQTRISALKWVNVLLKKDPKQVLLHRKELFFSLVSQLKSNNSKIESLTLEILAIIGTTEENFKFFIANLISVFCSDEVLFEKAGAIIKKLSLLLNPEKLLVEISSILASEKFFEENGKFCREFIRKINIILLTSKELGELRNLISNAQVDESSFQIFLELYKSWCHNPVSVISLCLLSETYELAYDLIVKFGSEMEITVQLLMEIDTIVQLLESPVFTKLRLKILEPNKYPNLLKTMYGILMLLPQSTAYEKLSRRLSSVRTLISINDIIDKREKRESLVMKEKRELLTYFSKIWKQNENLSV